MAYKHGVYVSEAPTSVIPAVNSMAGLPVIFGTAPLHLASKPAPVNRPVLCYSYKEAVEQFGYHKSYGLYSLCEVMYTQFALYNRGPVVFVNVLDPAVHKKETANERAVITDRVCRVEKPVLLDTLVIKNTADTSTPLTAGTDYEAIYNDDGVLIITMLADGAGASLIQAYLTYTYLDPGAVETADIIGGVDGETGATKGLECLNQVFPLTGLVPGIVMAPGWAHKPEVAAVMQAKANNINGHFKAITIVDITEGCFKYSDVPNKKNQNGFNQEGQIVCWPRVQLGGKVYHLSCHVLGVLATVDSSNDDIPFESPSNKSIQVEGACMPDGSEVILGPDEANYLNGQGVVTALNFMGGWKLWGNRMACYPATTDPKDAFIAIRRMFNWQAQTFIQSYWSKVDKPITKRLIQTVVDSENIRLNGLTARGAILGGRVEFQDAENPTTNLMDGIIRFHTYITPPAPAREIENTLEYDPAYFAELFR